MEEGTEEKEKKEEISSETETLDPANRVYGTYPAFIKEFTLEDGKVISVYMGDMDGAANATCASNGIKTYTCYTCKVCGATKR